MVYAGSMKPSEQQSSADCSCSAVIGAMIEAHTGVPSYMLGGDGHDGRGAQQWRSTAAVGKHRGD